MTWAIDVTGTKSGVAKKVTEQLDAIAASYEGKEEAKDVLAAKERILALVAEVDLSPDESKRVSSVIKKVTERLDAIAVSHQDKSKEEAKDVLAAKERILALVAAVDLSPDKSSPAAEWNAIQVKANGAHNVNEKGIIDARMAIIVMRTHLAI